MSKLPSNDPFLPLTTDDPLFHPAANAKPPTEPAAQVAAPPAKRNRRGLSAELQVMAKMDDELDSLPAAQRERVLRWLCEKHHVRELSWERWTTTEK